MTFMLSTQAKISKLSVSCFVCVADFSQQELYFLNVLFSWTERVMERDKFMNPVEAKTFGLIDTVLQQPPKIEDEKQQASNSA